MVYLTVINCKEHFSFTIIYSACLHLLGDKHQIITTFLKSKKENTNF